MWLWAVRMQALSQPATLSSIPPLLTFCKFQLPLFSPSVTLPTLWLTLTPPPPPSPSWFLLFHHLWHLSPREGLMLQLDKQKSSQLSG